MGLALAQDESNVYEDIYASAENWLAPPAAAPSATGSILDAILSTGAGVVSAITQPDVVKATLNKYVFGSTNPIPQPGQPGYVGPGMPGYVSPSLIPGIPNLYLIIGGVGMLLLLSKRR
jgi:hypothetical protein